MTDHLVTMAYAKDKLGVTDTSVRRYTRDGLLNVLARTPGGHARFSKNEVDALCLANAETSRGSSNATTASTTPCGTTPSSAAPAARAWRPVTPARPRSGSAASSSKGQEPTDMLAMLE